MDPFNSPLYYGLFTRKDIRAKKKQKEEEEEIDAKSEMPGLRDRLDSLEEKTRKRAARRVIYLMRAGENMSRLFSEMLRCVKTEDLELKKLTYLYLINYSASEPEQAIMAVNTFVQDSQDPNPIVRALAVRTMCRIRIQSVAENMILPLKKSLDDESPYVRKTAALGVSKLYDTVPEVVESSGLFGQLMNLLRDENPMVVANTVTAIFEINEKRSSPLLVLNDKAVLPMLSALNECSEWCQVMILDVLEKYVPESAAHAESLIDRLEPFLKNSNPAVMIGAFKCIYAFMDYDERDPREIIGMIIPPIMTLLLSAEPQIQYVVLRTLSLFVVKYPKVLSKDITMFFCKYNDPSYIKMEKLDIMMTICSRNNAKVVLDELGEYCNEVDVAFVRKAIRAVGQIAVKFEGTAHACVDVLVKMLQSKGDYAVEEAIVVVCDILRKYPGRYEKVISKVCASLEQIKEPASRAAAVWILGEYCDRIDNIDVLIDPFIDTFHDEQPVVQLQIVTALAKMFIISPDTAREQLQFILNEASKDSVVPDVRNQALIYWRLLTDDIKAAQNSIIFSKEGVKHSGVSFDESVLSELMKNLGRIAGVLHEVPSAFVRQVRFDHEGEASGDDHTWRAVRVSDDVDFIDMFTDIDSDHFYLKIINRSASPIKDFAFAVNKNMIGFKLGDDSGFPPVLLEDESAVVEFEYMIDPKQCANYEQTDLEFALRTNYGTVFARGRIPIEWSLQPTGKITQEQFTKFYNQFQNEVETVVDYATIADDDTLNRRKVFVIGKNQGKTFVCFVLPSKSIFVGELEQYDQNVHIWGLSSDPELQPLIESSARYLFVASHD